jgi:xanthine/uracil permease
MSQASVEDARNGRGTHPVDEVLPPGRLAAFGLQHVMTMYAGIIAVPLIVATAIGLPPQQLVYIINASFFMCGVATLVQAIGFPGFGAKLPIVQGTARRPRALPGPRRVEYETERREEEGCR